MNTLYLKLLVKIQDLMSREEGQDLVEYALITALIATAVMAGMKTVATALNAQFTLIGKNIT